jgi:hypothetical protein
MPILLQNDFQRVVKQFWFKEPAGRARLIQVARLLDSIVAFRRLPPTFATVSSKSGHRLTHPDSATRRFLG